MTVYVFFGCGAMSAAAKVAVTPPAGDVLPIGYFGVPFVWGFLIVVLIFCVRSVSGGHLNPAVTMSLLLSRNMPFIVGFLYIVAQVMGAIFGAAILRAIVGADQFTGTVALGDGVSEGQAFALESILSFFWVFTFLCTMLPRPNDVESHGKNVHSPIPIGLAVFVSHIVAVPFTGCGINPARVLGPAIIQDQWDDDHHWLYWIGPLIGASVAAFCFYILYGRVDEDEEEAMEHQRHDDRQD